MRAAVRLVLVLFLLAVPLRAQAAHSATINWTASSDAAANPSLGYNVYRFSGQCTTTGSPIFTKLNSAPVSALTYTDSGLAVGSYCYRVTATLNGVESQPSNTGGGTAAPAGVTITVTVQ